MAMTYTYFAGEEDSAVSYTYSPVIDVSTATLTLTFQRDIDDAAVAITIANASFDKTDGATGVILWPFTAANLATAGTYYGELEAIIDADNTTKKAITLWIREAVT